MRNFFGLWLLYNMDVNECDKMYLPIRRASDAAPFQRTDQSVSSSEVGQTPGL